MRRLALACVLSLVSVLFAVVPARAGEPVDGPVGRGCAYSATHNPSPDAGDDAMTGEVNAGPMLWNQPFWLHCRLKVNSGTHAPWQGGAATAAWPSERVDGSEADEVSYGSETVHYSPPDDSQDYLCTSVAWPEENGPNWLFWHPPGSGRDALPGTADDELGHWSKDSWTPCRAATQVNFGGVADFAEADVQPWVQFPPDVPPTVRLRASVQYAASSGWPVVLTAEASEVEPNTLLRVVETNTGAVVAQCFESMSCRHLVRAVSGTRSFVAYVVRPTTWPEIRSASNPVTVYWHRPSVVTLTAAPPVAASGEHVRLDAVADDAFGASFVRIWDVTAPSSPVLVGSCRAAPCSVTVTRASAGSRDFVAHVSRFAEVTFGTHDGASAPVRATWVDARGGVATASARCDGGQQVVDSTTEGVRVKTYVSQPSPDETHVCVRAENVLTGEGFGGQFVVTPTVPGGGVTNVRTPSDDDQSSLCTATVPNTVPGSHPVTTGGVAGTPYMVDAYATTGEAWICLQAASTHVRVKVPVAVPDVVVTPGTQVGFVPDPGTPDVL